MHPDTPYKKFKKIIKRYNNTVTDEKDKLPDIPLHGLRHTSATLLISQNIDVKTVSNRLGHSQASTTIDIYTHALKQLDKKAAETLDNLLINYSIHKITSSMCLIVHMDIMTEENYFIICLLFFQFLK